MSLAFGNKQFRNLQEQVWKNMTDIEDLQSGKDVLNAFGIKVVGQVSSSSQLPFEEEYNGSYGDAYAVGTNVPYSYYIWTRPNGAVPIAHWLYIGYFPLQGPTGATGPQGPEGPKGSPGQPLIVQEEQPYVFEEGTTNPILEDGTC